MDAIEFLTQHHRTLEQHLERLKKSEQPDRATFEATADALAAHITVEEQLFYPAVKAARTEDILLESLEEHLSLKRVLADLLALETADPRFSPKMHVLAEQAEHHHKEEEEHLFPKVKKLFDRAQREELGRQLEARMGQLERKDVREEIPAQTQEATAL